MGLSRAAVVIGGVAATAIGTLVLIYMFGDPTMRAMLQQELAKVLLQLLVVGLVGMYAKHLLDRHAAERSTMDALRKSRVDALNALLTAYFSVKRSLHIIGAHASAKSYGKQIRNIIDARLQLQRLNNEVSSGLQDFHAVASITSSLDAVDALLDRLIQEWQQGYLPLARLQNTDEANAEVANEQVLIAIDHLPVLGEVRANRFEALHQPFERAARAMRQELGLLGGIPAREEPSTGGQSFVGALQGVTWPG